MKGVMDQRDQRDHPDARLVSIFRTDDPGVLPLATMALEAEGIDYAVRNAGKADSLQWQMSQQPTNRPVVLEIVVTSDIAAKARDLVVDLEQPAFALASPDPSAVMASNEPDEPATIRLEEAAGHREIGTITEAQLQSLTSHLEEEQPQQYFISPATLELLEQAHADPGLMDILRRAVGPGGLAIRWLVR